MGRPGLRTKLVSLTALSTASVLATTAYWTDRSFEKQLLQTATEASSVQSDELRAVLEGRAVVRALPPKGNPERAVIVEPGYETRVAPAAVSPPRPRRVEDPSMRGGLMVARGDAERRRNAAAGPSPRSGMGGTRP